jgi:hypothetical protein
MTPNEVRQVINWNGYDLYEKSGEIRKRRPYAKRLDGDKYSVMKEGKLVGEIWKTRSGYWGRAK